ncbi:MAG: N-acetylneuraminate synthase family protein [Planctomycetota bacterium]
MMTVLGVILARAGSKGLPGKCMRELLGRPVIAYTFEHARASRLLTDVVFSTDSDAAKVIAREAGIEVIDRPPELASDTATVDAAARHAVEEWERRHPGGEELKGSRVRGGRVDAVVLLYGNIPVRAEGLIDRAIEHLMQTGADSVRSVAPVSKQHPDWVHRLEGDRMVQFRANSIYRRQDLEPLYYHDGAIAVVTRAALFGASETPDDHQSFLGRDRRAIVCSPEDAVDIDEPLDLLLAEAVLRGNVETQKRRNAEARRRGGTEAQRQVVEPQSHEATKRRSDEGETPKHRNTETSAKGGDQTRGTSKGTFGADAYSVTSSRTVGIAHSKVGPGERVFIVAEAGVNHDGSVETALRMVDAAAEAGADAVKFQMFRATELATASAATAAYQGEHCGAKSQREMLTKLELTVGDFERIARRCEELGIALVITPFGVEDAVRIEKINTPFGQHVGTGGSRRAGTSGIERQEHCSQSSGTSVAAIKIASTDLTNGPLLDAATATGMPLILSTGASTAEEISEAVEGMARRGAIKRLVLLHCVSCYPTPMEAINLRAIAALRREFGVPVGLSDHTTSVEMGGWAVAAGACVLEKHFTLDRAAAGPDHAMSLTPEQLAEYVRKVREVEAVLGDGTVGMTQIEEDVRAAARKSVVSAVAIRQGTRLARSMLTLKRPGTGIPPNDLATLLGREAATDIPSDTLLSWDMVR